MHRARVIHVHLELLGVETGHWCRPCALSSGIRVWYVRKIVGVWRLCSETGCLEHDHDDVELVDNPTTVWQS
jgi:hypothetical protein